MRLSVCDQLESRDGTLAKDSKLKNLLIETIDGNKTAIKRPGIEVDIYGVSGGGIGQGLVGLGDLPYSIVNDILIVQLAPVPYSTGMTAGIVTPVIFDDETFFPRAPYPPDDDRNRTPPTTTPTYPTPVIGGPGVPGGTNIGDIAGGTDILWGRSPARSIEYGFYHIPSGVGSIIWGFSSPLAVTQCCSGPGPNVSIYAIGGRTHLTSNNGGPWHLSTWGVDYAIVSRAYVNPNNIPL